MRWKRAGGSWGSAGSVTASVTREFGKFSVGNGRPGRGRVGQDGELGQRAFNSDRLQCSRAKDGGDSIRWWEMVVGWCPTCTWVISAAGGHTLVQVFCQNNFCL